MRSYLTKTVRPSGERVRIVQVDSERVFIGEHSSFRKTCEKEGIQIQASPPYRHEQNGVAERRWRTLGNCLAAILHGAGLSRNFWVLGMNYMLGAKQTRH